MAKIKLAPKVEILKKFPDMEFPKESDYVYNPFSGQGTQLTPEALALYHKVKSSEILYHRDSKKGYKPFRTSLDLFRKLFPSEYMVLLD